MINLKVYKYNDEEFVIYSFWVKFFTNTYILKKIFPIFFFTSFGILGSSIIL